MGMANSAQSFQRLVESVIGDMENCFVYLDDILVFTDTEEEHVKVLDELFKRLEKAGLTLALKKCQFGSAAVDYLGYTVSQEGLTPIKKKIEALDKFPPPQKQKDLLAFLGALNYYRASLPRLSAEESCDPQSPKSRSPAAVLDPLYKLATCKLNKNKNEFKNIWEGNEIVRNAFQDAKTLLNKAVTLNFPIPNAPLALSTDASKYCLGASLDQWVNGAWRPLGLWSKSLKPEQQRYSTFRRELLAIKYAVRHFIDEINGRTFCIYTDHKPLVGSWKNQNLQQHDTVALNAINEVAQWTSDVRYKPGKDLLVPDLLSRPFHSDVGTAYLPPEEPEYVPPELTMAALEEVALNVVSPSKIAEAQQECQDVKNHKLGHKPSNAVMDTVNVSGQLLYCEVSQKNNPRPLLHKDQRSLVLNLLHHQDHPSAAETLRRVSKEYYWPCLKKDVEAFVRTCHPCQLAKQSPTVNPGTGKFPVPDQRFSAIHLDVVGPLPESEGMKYLLTTFCRTSRWFEAFPMASASSQECVKAFMKHISRFGVPRLAISDNGNSFVANLYQDIMKTFNIEVKFTPAYHAATNGAIERRHQTIKNALKASLVDMGNNHGDKWMRALPWVLLGKRVAYQPDLDSSASMLVFGKSVDIPGQVLGHPGPPLNNLQTRALLEEMYKLEANPAIETSSKTTYNDISFTDNTTHVYIKKEDPRGLSPRFEGPYEILSRPSRSQVEVRLGSYVNGEVRKATYHWSSCKPAYNREGFTAGERPKLGRKARPDPTNDSPQLTVMADDQVPKDAENKQPVEMRAIPRVSNHETSNSECSDRPSSVERGKIQTSRQPHPDYLAKGDVITREMFDKWTPDLLNLPNRPVRSTRNPNPNYVD